MNDESTFRPKSNLVWGGCAVFLDVLFLVQVLIYPTKQDNVLVAALVCAAVGVLSYLIWFKPKLVFNTEEVVVVNPFRTEAIKYSDITQLDTKWALLIHHAGKQTRVWVAPANGKQRWIADSTNRWGTSKMPRSDRATGEASPASASLNSDSGIAAELLRQRINASH
jgi:hypothetical protein